MIFQNGTILDVENPNWVSLSQGSPVNTNRDRTLVPFLPPFIQAHPEVASDHVASLESSKKTSLEARNHIKIQQPWVFHHKTGVDTGFNSRGWLKRRGSSELGSRVTQLVKKGHFLPQQSCSCFSPRAQKLEWDWNCCGFTQGLGMAWKSKGFKEPGRLGATLGDHSRTGLTVHGYWLYRN